MATKQARGMKRTCQSSECGARFYDLARNPIVCPVCGTVYELASSPLNLAAIAAEEKAARKARKAEFVVEKAAVVPDAAVDAEVEEALPDIEEGDEEIAAEEDETFLPVEEEEGGDVTNIIGGPVAEGEEER
jgi:uncharacterized protein (TIGR02300 family)